MKHEINNRKLKAYIVGPNKHHTLWSNTISVDDMSESDVVILTGGEDINPELYNEDILETTWMKKTRDTFEIEEIKKAIKLEIPLVGVCRGAHLLTIMAGGKMVQHMTHPYKHDIKFYEGSVISVNSHHHQLMKPFNLTKDKYTIVAHSKGLSPKYKGGNGSNILMPSNTENDIIEPEIVLYNNINALCIQSRPDKLPASSALVEFSRSLLNQLVNKQLKGILKLKLPLREWIKNKDFTFTDDHMDQLDKIQIMDQLNKNKNEQGSEESREPEEVYESKC